MVEHDIIFNENKLVFRISKKLTKLFNTILNINRQVSKDILHRKSWIPGRKQQIEPQNKGLISKQRERERKRERERGRD